MRCNWATPLSSRCNSNHRVSVIEIQTCASAGSQSQRAGHRKDRCRNCLTALLKFPRVRRPWMGPSDRTRGFVALAHPRDLIHQRQAINAVRQPRRDCSRVLGIGACRWLGRRPIGGASMKRQLPLRSHRSSCCGQSSGNQSASKLRREIAEIRERKFLLWHHLRYHRPPSSN